MIHLEYSESLMWNITGDYMVDEKNRQVELTELGHQKVEDALIRWTCCSQATVCIRRQI